MARMCFPIGIRTAMSALVVLLLIAAPVRSQDTFNRDFIGRYAFSMGNDFGFLIALKALANNPRSDEIRGLEQRLIANAALAGFQLQLRSGRADGSDRDAVTSEFRRASDRLTDHLTARFGTSAASAYGAGYNLFALAAVVTRPAADKNAAIAKHRQEVQRAGLDPKTFAPFYEFVLATTNFDTALQAVERARQATLRDLDHKLIDTPVYRRLRANVFQASFALSTAALAGRADLNVANRQFERARIFAENVKLDVPGFTPPVVDLARVPSDGTDGSTRTAMILHYLLEEQEWINKLGEVYGRPVADLGTAAVRMGVMILLYGPDDMGKVARGAVCSFLRASGIPVAVWKNAVDPRLPFEAGRRQIMSAHDEIVAFLESNQKSDPAPAMRGRTDGADCPAA